MEPLQTGLQGEPGESATGSESESALRASIKVEQTYYYVLVPFDTVGNSDYLVREDNAIKVDVEDMFWDYHLAPPPPAPEPDPSLPGIGPSPWYGRLIDDINSGPFQQAGTICVALMVLNLLMIPMLINKYKEVKVKIKRKRAKKAAMDDFGDFYE
ncbi:MAG: hypothetical protein VYA86_01085 [Candidatus Thermoplasmatota archaeon]|nr:hypothetical protein [Candidatus Thermoplasmatota archaeon]